MLSHPVTSSFLWLHGLQPTRLLCPWKLSRQEYWSGLSCPPPGDRPNPRTEPRSPALQADSLPPEPPIGPPISTTLSSCRRLPRLLSIFPHPHTQPPQLPTAHKSLQPRARAQVSLVSGQVPCYHPGWQLGPAWLWCQWAGQVARTSGRLSQCSPAGSCRAELSAPGQATEQVQAALSFPLHLRPEVAPCQGHQRRPVTGMVAEVDSGSSPARWLKEGSPELRSPLSSQGMVCGRVSGVLLLLPWQPQCAGRDTALAFRIILELAATRVGTRSYLLACSCHGLKFSVAASLGTPSTSPSSFLLQARAWPQRTRRDKRGQGVKSRWGTHSS